MKNFTYAALATAFLMAAPAFGVEIECTAPAQSSELQAGSQRDDAIMLDDALVRKRQQTREADLARARKRLERAQSRSATAPAAPSGPVERN